MSISTKYPRHRNGPSMRTKALSAAMRRKEEFLGARVPKELKEKVIAQADVLGVPASILIRKILENAFNEGEPNGWISGLKAPAPEHRSVPAKAAANRFPTVLGWEKIRLNRQMACTGCGKCIRPGVDATLGLSMRGEDHIILCDVCSESL
ncbi:MAG: hypothetical protein P8164_09910 [Gammaproteobacteria bacterium]|jgi:hypothetical protein